MANVGFAFVEGKGLKTTTGGKNGKKFVIDGDEKEFRNVCEDLIDNNEPSIIILRGSFDFKGDDKVDLPSNCTVFGEDCKIKGGFNIESQSNVIIKNVCFEDAVKYGKELDNLLITESSHHIWVDHCTFTKTGDGLLDIKRESSYVTVSWCKFGKDHNKTMLIGHSDDHDEDIGNLKVTLHHNWFAGDSRNPRIRFGVVHAFNNYYDSNSSYCSAAVLNGKLISESNYFYKTDDVFIKNVDGNYDSDEEGDIFNISNYFDDVDDDKISNYQKDKKTPELPYNFDKDDAKDVKKIVEKSAGYDSNEKFKEIEEPDKNDEDSDIKVTINTLLEEIENLNKKTDKNLKKISKGKKNSSEIANDSRTYTKNIDTIIEELHMLIKSELS